MDKATKYNKTDAQNNPDIPASAQKTIIKQKSHQLIPKNSLTNEQIQSYDQKQIIKIPNHMQSLKREEEIPRTDFSVQIK